MMIFKTVHPVIDTIIVGSSFAIGETAEFLLKQEGTYVDIKIVVAALGLTFVVAKWVQSVGNRLTSLEKALERKETRKYENSKNKSSGDE
jgi:hypothetical protein